MKIREINWIGHLVKTNPIKANLPAFDRKSEALNSKPVLSNVEGSETSPAFRAGMEMRDSVDRGGSWGYGMV